LIKPDTVIAEMQDWAAHPLDGVYVAVFIDAIMVKEGAGRAGCQPARLRRHRRRCGRQQGRRPDPAADRRDDTDEPHPGGDEAYRR